MSRIWYSADPGKDGGLAKWKDRTLIDIFDFNLDVYKNELSDKEDLQPFFICEKIDTVYQGAYAGFLLGQRIGELRGLCKGLGIEFITEKSTPNEWKSPWKDQLIKPKGEKWPKGEAIKRYCDLCIELYPNFDFYAIEHLKTKDKKVLKDGRCAAVMIGRSFIERNLIDNYL